ncbi:MAG: branched-chain amino acid ABC transporter permease [Clostridia bacterium]|nr:branched-chain amino acid ABC transporter permease [Clostridia bacterium]
METLINGLSLGGIYALIALGYTMVYGIAKMLNFAHGDIIMAGAYAILLVVGMTGNLLLSVVALIAAIAFCVLLGVTTERLAYRPLRGASPLAVLITAIGVSYLLQSIAQLFFTSEGQPVSTGAAQLGSVTFLGANLKLSSLITLGLCVMIMTALTLFVDKTRVGRAMLAVSEDRGAASLMGINTNLIITLTFAIGSALAAFASLFYLMQFPVVSPTLGSMPGIKAFTAAVIGGIGSIPGAMVGGVLLGVIECVCQSIPALSPYTIAIEFGLLIIILLVRPVGLLGKKRREKV